jgi:parallel beta-helix repeat protein
MIRRPAEHVAASRVWLRSRLFRRGVTALVFSLVATACHGSSPIAPGNSSSRTVYVSTTGSDRNAGTIGAPWQTLSFAVAQLHAGDTLYIRGGTYTGVSNRFDSLTGMVRGGTSWSNPITIAGYQSEVVIVQPPDAGLQGIRLTSSAQQYLIFQDFIVDMINLNSGTADGVYLSGGANHNRFLRLEVRNNLHSGIAFSDNNGNAPFNEVVNCKLHDNGRGMVSNSGYGMYWFTSDNLIEGNEIYNNNGYGLHLFTDANASRNIIRMNNIHDNQIHGAGGPGGSSSYGIVVGNGDSNQVSSNMISNNQGGILVSFGATNTTVNGNTIYNNTPLEGILIQMATNTVVKDNIVYGNGTQIVNQGTGTVLSNNGA